ncbi:hypothetical protein A5886_000216 [Enterococcus sp. 8G7_MSG3316]|uniref:Uncharacterized protein n=1 Tax=Candidatus Enterococcus testudinis TaxID=1834191 RepID=A0A242A285_9ENTE|nr:hypothetical protein [Enterococcus sp. 8G7_MSG3316]OTN75146.1 hypothetical protein A5886_000216 [Enterococcus sp. 8G7_MSG3316]
METSVYTVIIPALITGLVTFFAAKISSKASLEQTNIDNAQKLYKKYEALNLELTNKLAKIEAENHTLDQTYQQAILIYQSKLAQTTNERDYLKLENQRLLHQLHDGGTENEGEAVKRRTPYRQQ